MNREIELKYLKDVIESKKILFRNYWLTITSFVSAMLVGGSIAFLTNNLADQDLQEAILFFYKLLPFLFVVLAEIFFRSLEYNLIFERILLTAKNYPGNDFLENSIRLINLEFEASYPIKRISDFIRDVLLSIVRIRFLYLILSASISFFIADTNRNLFFGAVIAFLVFFGFSYSFHKYLTFNINKWPLEIPWLIKKSDTK